MLIIPAIDLREGKCVRLTQGRRDASKTYDHDPVAVAQSFAAAGARMLHIVDLDGAFAERNFRNRRVLREIIRAVDIPVQFGGGIRDTKDVSALIKIGITRVVIGTLAVESPEVLTKMIHLVGSRHIAVGLDASNGQVLTHGWEREQHLSALALARSVAAIGIERIIYTDVQCDGMLTGPNIDQTRIIARGSGLKVTASGGVSSLDDLRKLKAVSASGVDSVIVGKALYEGRFALEDALRIV